MAEIRFKQPPQGVASQPPTVFTVVQPAEWGKEQPSHDHYMPKFLNDGDPKNIARLKQAFKSTMAMLEVVRTPKSEESYRAIFSQWFPESELYNVKIDLINILGWNSQRPGNPKMANIDISLQDPYKKCRTAHAYTHNHEDNKGNISRATIYFCPSIFRYKDLNQLTCSSVGDRVSDKMETLEMLFAHEIMHLVPIVRPDYKLGIGHITDYKYGAKKCLRLAQEDPVRAFSNADSHAWFQSHVYWSEKCGKILEKPEMSQI
ncbi:hypothetical protein B0O99DRAFT_593188 [Bisporella sp. PMI_857]|nr:hypothetical protein B0O99DRAFT_593188 [Bisporella sp. PMI_857]